jgi:hypothetical protein
VASRKQRRRRQKERRHEYEYVYVDERGEEVELDEEAADERPPARAQTREKEKEKEKPKPAPYRGGREVPPPSWRRVGRRGLIFAPFMFLTLLLLDRGQAYGVLAINTIVLLAFFLPFSYVLDTLMYRVYMKRAGGQGGRTAARRR